MNPIYFIIGGIVLLLVLLFLASYVKAGPDEAIMVSGVGKPKILIGRAGFRIPFLQRKDRLSLKAFQVDIRTSEAIPTREFINISVDGVANLKISSKPELMTRAFEALLKMKDSELISQVQQVLQGNMREIIGTVAIKELVQDRQGVAEKVRENVIPDMEKLGIELINFNIQSFSDDNDVIVNLGIDNVTQISKDAAIAKANATKEVQIAESKAREEANAAKVAADTKIEQQNTEYKLKQSELKEKSDTAQAQADAAYEIEKQKKLEQINITKVNAEIAKREREVDLGNREVELTERKLQAEINKKAEAEKYAAEQKAQAELFTRQKAAEAEKITRERKAEADKFEAEREAEVLKLKAEAEKIAREKDAEALKIEAEARAAAEVAKAEAAKQAALAEAEGIRAKGDAEAEAILKKADAMKQYGEAATLQLILDSGVLPELVKAYSQPMAEAMGKIGNITMYGEGNTAKLGEEITKNSSQIFAGLEQATGLDVKSMLAGFLGGKLISKDSDKKD